MGGVGVYGDGGAVGVSGWKPWDDSAAYDVGVESGSRILRVQVKLTDRRTQYGYLCQFKPNAHSNSYTLKQVDFFAAYVIPRDVWYLIPAGILLGRRGEEGGDSVAGESAASGSGMRVRRTGRGGG